MQSFYTVNTLTVKNTTFLGMMICIVRKLTKVDMNYESPTFLASSEAEKYFSSLTLFGIGGDAFIYFMFKDIFFIGVMPP